MRLQALPSAEPEERLAASYYIRTRGWRGRASGPAGPGQRGSKKGPRTGWPAPALGREEVLPGPGVPNHAPRLPALGLPALPQQLPGRGEQAPGAGAEGAPSPPRSAGLGPRELKLGLPGFGEEHPPQHPASFYRGDSHLPPSSPLAKDKAGVVSKDLQRRGCGGYQK